MDCESDIVIAGGGLNGPATALALAQAGLSVTLVDSQTASDKTHEAFDGRAYALALASRRLLSAIGVWQQVQAQAQPILDVKIGDGHPGEGPAPLFLHFDHHEIEEGPMGFMLEDRFLRRAFLEALENTPNVSLITGVSVVSQHVQPAGVSVELDDGRTISARLLVGCDGRRSGVAARAGMKRSGWGYGQTALVCAIAHELPHNGVAHQFFMPPGPLAILPLPGNRSSIVWSEADAQARVIAALNDADFLAALAPRFGDFLGAIKLDGKRFIYPLSLSLANQYVTPRVALVGDAAHGVHPIAGQGLNLGLRDVAALAETLVDAARRGEDFGTLAVLERYQSWRRFDATLLGLGMDAVNTLFSNDNPALRAARVLGMGAVGALPGLRRSFIREAAGLSGDKPRLLEGQPL